MGLMPLFISFLYSIKVYPHGELIRRVETSERGALLLRAKGYRHKRFNDVYARSAPT